MYVDQQFQADLNQIMNQTLPKTLSEHVSSGKAPILGRPKPD
jgi:hypothetical protein